MQAIAESELIINNRGAIYHLDLRPEELATTIITVGEACSPELVSAWAPGRWMFNAYGPTETTIWVTGTGRLSAGQPVPIGTPIPGVRALVLDPWLKPAPVGTGVIAGGPVRAVVQATGIPNVLTKSIGSHNPHNVVKATIDALEQLRDRNTVAEARGLALDKL